MKLILSMDTVASPNPLLKALSPLLKNTAALPAVSASTVAEVLHEPEVKLLNTKGYTLRASPFTVKAPVWVKVVESGKFP